MTIRCACLWIWEIYGIRVWQLNHFEAILSHCKVAHLVELCRSKGGGHPKSCTIEFGSEGTHLVYGNHVHKKLTTPLFYGACSFSTSSGKVTSYLHPNLSSPGPLMASPIASCNFFAAGPASPFSEYMNFSPVSSFVMLAIGRTDTRQDPVSYTHL